MYGFGHSWSLQIQLLLVAQSSSISFLLKSLHLAGLVRKFPIVGNVVSGELTLFVYTRQRLLDVVGGRFEDVLILLLNLV